MSHGFENVSSIGGFRKDFHGKIRLPISVLVQTTQLFQTSDPRDDKMFSFNNIAAHASDANKESVPRPKYSKSISAVCQEGFKYVIQAERSLSSPGSGGIARQTLDALRSSSAE